MASDPREQIVATGREARGGFRDRPWLIASMAGVVLAIVVMLALWWAYFL